MLTLLYSALIGYVVLWAVLLIACLRKREFCPIFSDSRKTRLFWLATFVLANPLLTVLYFFFGQIRPAQARPIRAVRDFVVVFAILGFFINIPGLTHVWVQPFMGRSADAGAGPQAHLAVIEAASKASTSSSTSGSDNSRLACRRMAVIVEGDHPLLHRIGSDLVEQLGKIPGVERVELRSGGVLPEGGRRAPDVFIRLYLADIQETPIPYSLKLRARIGAEVGRSLLASTHGYHDTFMPPLLDFNMRIQMSHRSTTTGYESVRYTMAAEKIAKDLGEQIGKALEQWEDKHGLLPELPDQFYGSYVPSELPEPIQKLDPVLLGSYAGLLTHNETYLRFSLAEEPVGTIEALRDTMTEPGWRVMSSDWTLPNLDLRLEKDSRRIHVFQIRRREPFSGEVVTRRPSEGKETFDFGIADEQRFSDDERSAVLDSLLNGPLLMDRLVLFERMFDKPQRERWFEVLKEQPPRDVFTQIRLGEMYQRRDMPEEALQALTRAKTLLWAVPDDAYENRLTSLAKKLGDEKLAKSAPTADDFRSAGFIEITDDNDSFDGEVGLDCPVVMFGADSADRPFTLSVTVVSSGNDQDPFVVKYAQRRLHGSSSGSRGGSRLPTGGPWQCNLNHTFDDMLMDCRITQIGSEERFKVSLTVTP